MCNEIKVGVKIVGFFFTRPHLHYSSGSSSSRLEPPAVGDATRRDCLPLAAGAGMALPLCHHPETSATNRAVPAAFRCSGSGGEGALSRCASPFLLRVLLPSGLAASVRAFFATWSGPSFLPPAVPLRACLPACLLHPCRSLTLQPVGGLGVPLHGNLLLLLPPPLPLPLPPATSSSSSSSFVPGEAGEVGGAGIEFRNGEIKFPRC